MVISCEICELTLRSQQCLSDHTIRYHSGTKLKCGYCENTYSSAASKNHHEREKHPYEYVMRVMCKGGRPRDGDYGNQKIISEKVRNESDVKMSICILKWVSLIFEVI